MLIRAVGRGGDTLTWGLRSCLSIAGSTCRAKTLMISRYRSETASPTECVQQERGPEEVAVLLRAERQREINSGFVKPLLYVNHV